MFFSESILSKKGSLARIWLAAHWERKLSKTQFLQTSIEQSVGAIVRNDQPLALRLSGQLLLGVVKIYSRKARYLLEDCNEALLRIKLAFRPGAVDLPDDQATAAYKTITLPDVITEFEILLPEPAFQLQPTHLQLSQASLSQSISRKEDITISEPSARLFVPDYGNELEADILAQPALEDEMGLDFKFDLGADVGRPVKRPRTEPLEAEDSMEIEVGRRAEAPDVTATLDGLDFVPDDSFVEAPHKEFAPFEDAVMQDADNGDFQAFEFNERSIDQHFQGDVEADALQLPDLDLGFDVVRDAGGALTPTSKGRKTKQAAATKKRKLHFDGTLEISSREIQHQLQNQDDIVSQEHFLPLNEAYRLMNLFDVSTYTLVQSDFGLPFANLGANIADMFIHLTPADTVHHALGIPDKRINAGKQQGDEVLPMSPRHDLDLPAVYEDTSFDQVQDGFGLNGPEDLIVVEHEAEAPHHDFPGQMTPLRQGIQERAETPFVLDQVAADIVKSKDLPTEQDETDKEIAMEAARHRIQDALVKAQGSALSFADLCKKAKREEAVRFFMEILLLKTSNAIDVKQDEPFGTIFVSLRKGLEE